jgi:hypothetical protein
MTLDGHARHAPAMLAAALALAAGVALIATSGGPTTRTKRKRTDQFPHTQAGAAAAATAWCQSTDEAFFAGTWDSAVSALATPAFAARAEHDVGPAATLTHQRLASAHLPFAARIWPLGYALQQYSPATARVRVWQLSVFVIAAPQEVTGYDTTDVSLRWTDGDWKVDAAPPGPELAPPARGATATEIAGWIDSIGQFREYRYAP